MLGDIRTAIGRALPLPLGCTIWIVAITIAMQKFMRAFDWNPSVEINNQPIELVQLILMQRTALLILMMTWFVSRSIKAFANLLNNWHMGKEKVELDSTAIQALASICVVLAWVIGLIVTMQSMGMIMSAIITVGGIGGAAFAFASKDVIANFFGGLLIMFNRPFLVGDKVESGTKISGIVKRVGLYATWLETEDGDTLYVPNSIFNSSEIKKKKVKKPSVKKKTAKKTRIKKSK